MSTKGKTVDTKEFSKDGSEIHYVGIATNTRHQRQCCTDDAGVASRFLDVKLRDGRCYSIQIEKGN